MGTKAGQVVVCPKCGKKGQLKCRKTGRNTKDNEVYIVRRWSVDHYKNPDKFGSGYAGSCSLGRLTSSKRKILIE
jgi:hypothetical protein